MNRQAYLEAYTAPFKDDRAGRAAAASAPADQPESATASRPDAPTASRPAAALPFLEEPFYHGPQHRSFDRLSLDLLSPPELVMALEDAGLSGELTAAELREMMAALSLSIDRLWEMVREKEVHIENFTRIAEEQENHIRNFQQMVEEKEGLIRNFQQMLAEKERRFGGLDSRKQADALKLRRIIEGRERTIAELERQLKNRQIAFPKSSGRRWHDCWARLRDVISRRPGSGGYGKGGRRP